MSEPALVRTRPHRGLPVGPTTPVVVELEEAEPKHPGVRLYLLIALMVILWSLNFSVAKIALRHFAPLTLYSLRTTLAALLLTPIFTWNLRRERTEGRPEFWNLKDLKQLVPLGVVGIGVNQLCFVMGIGRTSVAHSSLIMGTVPMIVLVIAALRRLERFTLKKLLGMSVAVSGILALNLTKTHGVTSATLTGDVLVFGGALAFSIYTVGAKEATRKHSAISVNTVAYGASALLLLPATVWIVRGLDFSHVALKGWLTLGYMAVFPSVVCFTIYYHALTHIPASRVSSLAYLQPVLATLLALAILGEPVTGGLAFGGALVVLGVWLSERK